MVERDAPGTGRDTPARGALGVGSELTGYRIEALLGRGAMSSVYLAEEIALERKVALKLLAPELERKEVFSERFRRESQLAASLDHANLTSVYRMGETEGLVFIATRYVEGHDLAHILLEERLPPQRAIEVASQVATALDAVHEHGLVHGDIKPSNVLVDAASQVYLTDLGLTRSLQAAGRIEDALKGTVDYLAPEQIEGADVDHRADQYSLGCVLYECLVGEPPFRRDSAAATSFAHLALEPPDPPALMGVFPKALAKAPDNRYASCSALVDAARRSLGLPEPGLNAR
jgi:serine/threonine protein kinase